MEYLWNTLYVELYQYFLYKSIFFVDFYICILLSFFKTVLHSNFLSCKIKHRIFPFLGDVTFYITSFLHFKNERISMMNKRKIIIITSKFLHVFVQHIIDELPLDCDVEIVEYKCFQDIKQIYQQYESTSDGFMLSGKAALAALEKALPDHRKPAVSFGSDLVSMYRLLLKHFVEQRTLRTDRVIFDFLLPIQENATVSYFLHDMDFPSTNTAVDNWLATLDIGRLSSIEEETSQKIIRLWEQNQFDLLICQYSSIIPVLEQHNIPYIYCYPEKEVFQSLVETLLAQIELSFFRENLPAAITISGTSSEIGEKDRAQLKTALYDFKA